MNKNTLDFPTPVFEQLLQETVALVLQQFEDIHTKKAYRAPAQQEIAAWFDEPMPTEGMEIIKLLGEVDKKVLQTATGNLGPHMYAYVMSGGNQVSILAELLANTINQNIGKWHLAPAVSEIEKKVAQWGANMIGLENEVGVLSE